MAEVADEAADDAISVADEVASLVADEQPERARAVTAAKPAAVSTERWDIIYSFSCLVRVEHDRGPAALDIRSHYRHDWQL
jgi:hypothetical protein